MKRWIPVLARLQVVVGIMVFLSALAFLLLGGSGQAAPPEEGNLVPLEQGIPMCPGVDVWQEEHFVDTTGPCGEFVEAYVAVYTPRREGSQIKHGRRIGTGVIQGREDSPPGYACFACGNGIDLVLRTIRLDATGQYIPIEPCRISIPSNVLTNRTRIQIPILLPGFSPPYSCETSSVYVSSGGVRVRYTPWFGINFSVQLPWPGVLYDVEPYPVGMVGNPTRVTLADMPSIRRSAYRFYWSRGGGNPSSPQYGDVRNIWYQVRLVPLTSRGALVLPPEAVGGPKSVFPGETVDFTWDLPSHPASGAQPAPMVARRLGVPEDFPAFSGENMSQAAYGLMCFLSWEEYRIDERGGYWVRRQQNGFIPLNRTRVSGDRRYLMDTNGDGKPEVLVNRQVVLRRRDASGKIVDTVALGERTYWWVREAQAQISR